MIFLLDLAGTGYYNHPGLALGVTASLGARGKALKKADTTCHDELNFLD